MNEPGSRARDEHGVSDNSTFKAIRRFRRYRESLASGACRFGSGVALGRRLIAADGENRDTMVALVLLPGLDGTGQLFADFAHSIGPDVEVIVASYPSDKALGYADLEPIARSFLPAAQDFFLLGESFSGPIAISIAASAPPGLRGLILCCSFARNPRPVLAIARPFLGAFPVAALPLALLSYFLIGRFSSARRRSALASVLACVTPAVLRRRVRAVLTVDVASSLSSVNVPVLYLRSSEDRLVPRSSSELLVALAPKCRIVDFIAPHFLLQVLPPAAAIAVVDFICLTSSAAPGDSENRRRETGVDKDVRIGAEHGAKVGS